MTNGNRISALLATLLILPLCACFTKELSTGLTEQDAQEIIVALQENGLDAVREREVSTDKNAAPSWTVRVKGGDQNLVLAWKVLQEHGLPRSKVKGLEEVFSSTGMIPTASEEKARLLMALSGELTRTLKSVAGVVDARVQVVLPENSPLLDKSQWSPTTASVLVKHQWEQPPLSEYEVKKLVARGVEGLQPENVAVVFKKVEPSKQARDIGWYLGNQQLLLISMSLMILASFGTLLLIFSNRRQRRTIDDLKRRLDAQSEPPQLVSEAASRGAA